MTVVVQYRKPQKYTLSRTLATSQQHHHVSALTPSPPPPPRNSLKIAEREYLPIEQKVAEITRYIVITSETITTG